MIDADYRNTFACKDLSNIAEAKKSTEEAIRADHPKSRKTYSYIKNKHERYYLMFGEAYNLKCGYCGVTTSIHSFYSFEIDHFICQSSNESDATIDNINNLVFSCDICNRNKHGLLIPEDYREILHPDLGSLGKVFKRNADYSISVSPKFESDECVNNFYKQLKLFYPSRRIDYLIMEIDAFCEKLHGLGLIEACTGLKAILSELLQYRNNHLPWSKSEEQ